MRAWRALAGLAVALALALQYVLMIRADPGRWPALTVNFFSYYTILSNGLAAAALLVPAAAPASRLGRWAAQPAVRGAMAVYLTIVGVTYHFLLAQVWDPQGLQFVADKALHYMSPAIALVDWLVFTPRVRLPWRTAALWLIFPLAYAGWTLVHGAAAGWFPYWFADYTTLGMPKALANLVLFQIAFWGVGLAFVALDRALARRDRAAVAP